MEESVPVYGTVPESGVCRQRLSASAFRNTQDPSEPFLHNDDSKGPNPHLRYVPKLFRFEDSPPEATGLAMDVYGRAAVLMSGVYLGPALLKLATEAVESQCVDGEECDQRIYGMRPSSLLTNISVGSGLISSLLLPLFGAVVDHTPYRRHLGIISAVGLTLTKGMEIAVSSKTWFPIALLQVIAGVLFQLHVCATFAYTSELSKIPKEQTKYNTHFNVVLFIATIIYLVEVVVVSKFVGVDDVGTARISLMFTFVTASIFFGYSWSFLFPNRPALSRVPEGSTLLGCGFRQIFQTTTRIWKEQPGLKWFMVAVVFAEAASTSLAALTTTFMKIHLDMNATEIGIVFLILLVSGLPGVKLGELISLKFNPLTSAKACNFTFMVAVLLSAFVMRGPEQKSWMKLFGALWGACLGWQHPVDTTIFITASPRGQESEMMGMYIFCGHVIAWLPPAIFTILNEAGVSMSVGMASLSIFFVLALLCLQAMGSYDKVVEQAKKLSNDAEIDLPVIT